MRAKPLFVRGSEISEDEFYRRTHEDSDWQYLGGRPVMAAAASNRHEDLFSFLLTLLRVFLDERGGGAVRGSRYPMRLDPRWCCRQPSNACSGSWRNSEALGWYQNLLKARERLAALG